MHTSVKTSSGIKLQLKALVDLGCTHTIIDKQLVTRFVPLELEINKHTNKLTQQS